MKDKYGKPYNRIRLEYVGLAFLGFAFFPSVLGWLLLICLMIECISAILLDARIVKEEENGQ